MNSYETITFEEVRDRAKAKLRQLNTTSDDAYIDLSIMDANRRILSIENTIQKAEVIDVISGIAQLPCDYRTFLLLFTAPQGDSELPMIYTDYPLDAPQGYTLTAYNNRFLIEQGVMKFPSNFNAEQVVLYYLAYNTTPDGFPILKLSHVDYYVWSVIAEQFEAMGDYKVATYWKNKALMNKRALVHNEQAVQLELDKVALNRVMYNVPSNLLGGGYGTWVR